MHYYTQRQTLPLSAIRSMPPLWGIADGALLFGRVRPVYYAGMDVPHYWTAEQVQRLLDALASHNRHQDRTAALIMWRTDLRVSEALELEWRDLNYAGDPATLLVRRSKSRKARTVRLHPELGAALHKLACEPVAAGQGGAAGHEDGAAPHRRGHRAGLDEETPGTGKRRPGAHSLRHSAARHWLMAGRVPLNVVSSWLGHPNVQATLRIHLPIVGSEYGMENVP